MNTKVLVSLFLILFLLGCQTPYQQLQEQGETGVSETPEIEETSEKEVKESCIFQDYKYEFEELYDEVGKFDGKWTLKKTGKLQNLEVQTGEFTVTLNVIFVDKENSIIKEAKNVEKVFSVEAKKSIAATIEVPFPDGQFKVSESVMSVTKPAQKEICGAEYSKVKGCVDECSSDSCDDFDYISCIEREGCKYKENKGKVKGKCNVECLGDNECLDHFERCVNYKCKETISEQEGKTISIELVEDSPPDEIFDDGRSSFKNIVKITNKINEELKNIKVKLEGFYPPDFDNPESTVESGSLKAGEETTLSFSGFKYVNTVSSEIKFLIRVNVYYNKGGVPYVTYVDHPITVKP